MEYSTRMRNGIFAGSKTLSIMPTYTCTAACKDCGTLSSPEDHSNVPLETIISAIDQAYTLGFADIVFTGGEATLRWKDLKTSISHAKTKGFPVRLVTNAHWATSLPRAQRMMAELVECGLDEINYSTGDEHVRFIPIERIVNAVVAGLQTQISVLVMIELRKNRTVSKDVLLAHPGLADIDLSKITIEESPWMPLDPFGIEIYPEHIAAHGKNYAKFGGCPSVLQTYVLEGDGRVASCCGLGMRFTEELQVGVSTEPNFLANAIQTAESDFMKVWIRYMGPIKILKWASEKRPGILWENMYAHQCQACVRIYSDPTLAEVIRENYHEIESDVIFRAWMHDYYCKDIGAIILDKLKSDQTKTSQVEISPIGVQPELAYSNEMNC